MMPGLSRVSLRSNGCGNLIDVPCPGKPSTERADHLFEFSLPMLSLQGTRDTFTELDLLRPILNRLGEKASLHIVEGADHSFHMLKSSGLDDGEVIKQLARVTADWVVKKSGGIPFRMEIPGCPQPSGWGPIFQLCRELLKALGSRDPT